MASSYVLCFTYIIIIIIILFDNASNTIPLFKGVEPSFQFTIPSDSVSVFRVQHSHLPPLNATIFIPLFAPRFPLEIGEESNSKGTRLFMVQRYLQGAYEHELLTVKTHRCSPTFSTLSRALVNSFLVFSHTKVARWFHGTRIATGHARTRDAPKNRIDRRSVDSRMAVAFRVQTLKLSQHSVKTCAGRKNRTVLIVNMAATRETFQSFHEPYHIPCTVPSTNTKTFRFLSNFPSFLPRSTLIDTYRGEIYAKTRGTAHHLAEATVPCLLSELPKLLS